MQRSGDLITPLVFENKNIYSNFILFFILVIFFLMFGIMFIVMIYEICKGSKPVTFLPKR